MDAPKTIANYIVSKELGSGAFATVYAAQERQSLTRVAIKAVSKQKMKSKAEFELLQREVALMRSIDHPFVISFFEVMEDPQFFYIAMEMVPNGNLLNYINRKRGLKEDEACRIFCQIVSVLDYLHNEKKIAHRDLKCENVLLDKNMNIRIADFGLSKSFDASNPFLETTCGSPAYVAPEIIKEKPYTTAADIWSLGVLLYAMVCARLPFHADSVGAMLQAILNDKPVIPSHLSPELQDLLKALLKKDPRHRITLADIKRHPWVKDYKDSIIFDLSSNAFKTLKVMNIESLDPSVLYELRTLGIQVKGLLEELNAGAVNKRTAMYKMLKRQITIDEIDAWQKRKIERVASDELYYGNLPFILDMARKAGAKLQPKAPTTVEVKPISSKFKPKGPLVRRPLTISPKPQLGARVPAYI